MAPRARPAAAKICDGVNDTAYRTVAGILEGKEYAAEKAPRWSQEIGEATVEALQAGNGNFKYIVSCTLSQKVGGGLHFSSTTYWDQSKDGSATVRWENDSLTCILIVYGVAL